MDGITDAMKQYERTTESILKDRPKRSKAYGVKRPDTPNIVAVLAGLFVIIVVVAQFLM